MPPQRDDLFDEDTEDTQDEGDARSGDSTPPDDSSDPPASENSDKRINDLMAAFRKEQARANKAEAALKAASGDAAGQPTSDEGSASSPAPSEFESFMRESVRKQLYAENPELKAYGLQASDIAGERVEDMRASVERHRKLIQKIAGTAKQQVLTEHGLTPDIGGSVSTDPKDWDSMPRDEFEKAVQAALNRGA